MRIGTNELLEKALRWLGQRHHLIGQNVSQIDTPGYRPVNMRRSFADAIRQPRAGALAVAATDARHLMGRNLRSVEVAEIDTEEKIAGNRVNLESEMAALAEVNANSQIVSTMYKKNMQFLKLVVRGPRA